MNRLIGMACPACAEPLTDEGDLLDDGAMCMHCGAVIWIDEAGAVRVIDEQELARFDSEVKRTIARALDELGGTDEPLQ